MLRSDIYKTFQSTGEGGNVQKSAFRSLWDYSWCVFGQGLGYAHVREGHTRLNTIA